MSDEIHVRRVVVVLDGAERTVTIVREAARVASRFGAELEGLLVEDEELLRLAGHGFARRIGGRGAAGLEAKDLEREWRALAEQLRGALEREAGRSHVTSRFEVTRGRSSDAVRERLAGGDVVVIGWGGWAPSAGRTAPVRVLWDGTASAERALDVGARLAGPDGQLLVWIVPDGKTLEEVRALLTERVGSQVGRLLLAPLADDRPSTLRHAVGVTPGGLLVVPSESRLADQLASRSVAARFGCSVLVVR